MQKPDQQYLTELTEAVRGGDMNAFAELYAATCRKQYAFAMRMTGDTFSARSALEETFVTVLNTLSQLRDDTMITVWITRINFRICLRMRGDGDPEGQTVYIGRNAYSIRRLMGLPYTEGQALLLVHYCRMSIREAAQILETGSIALRRAMAEGLRRLKQQPGGNGGTA